MKKAPFIIIGIFLSLLLIGCSAQEAIHVTLDGSSDVAQVIIRGQTGDTTYQEPAIDVATGAFQVVDTDHHEVHEGKSFHISELSDLGNGANVTFLFITPDTAEWAHLIWIVEHELETQLELYEDTVVSNNGSGLTIYNRDRNSANTPSLLVFKTPTIISVGTLLDDHQAGSGKKAGGENRASWEWILKQNSFYIIRITNQTANNNIISSQFIWYEHTNRSP